MIGNIHFLITGIILYKPPANERRRYIVTSSLIGWTHTQNDPQITSEMRNDILFHRI